MSILEVKNLSVVFGAGTESEKKAVDDISFELNKGEVLGIVGESGSGKSVTSLAVLGLLPYPKAQMDKKSSIIFEEKELVLMPDKDYRLIRGNKIAYIFQEPMSSLNPLHTIEKQIGESLMLHQHLNSQNVHDKVLNLLKMTGIQNAEKRMKSYPFELSGGQRQRVMIAMAIANRPDILIADEPTTALDVTVQEQIIKLLKNLKEKLNMSIIFISHDLGVIKKIADNVVVMKDGKIIEKGAVKEVFEHPQHTYTKELINSKMVAQQHLKTDEILLKSDKVKVIFPLKKNLWGRVTEQLFAVNEVSFDLKKGATLGIVGESGSGKTTLGSAIIGLNPYQGKIYFQGKDLKSLSAKERRKLCKDIQVVFQDPFNSLNPRMMVEKIVEEGLLVHYPKTEKRKRREKVLQVLQEVGLCEADLMKYPHEFSGGQRQRIALARALILEPKLLILDEPTSALDVTIQAQIIRLLQNIQDQRQLSYIFISHDMNAIRAMSDDILVLKDGKVVEYGVKDEVFYDPKQAYTKELIAAAK